MSIQQVSDKKFKLEMLQDELDTIKGELEELRMRERSKQAEVNQLANEIDDEESDG